jgi:hypothetical protein
VWTLRRFRDNTLSSSWGGKKFIQLYYVTSPKAVKLFGNKKWFNKICKAGFNKLINILQNKGVDSSPYID